MQCTKVPVITDKHNVHESEVIDLILTIIFVVPRMYITFATRKSKASHFLINLPLCSLRSYRKIGKNMETLGN